MILYVMYFVVDVLLLADISEEFRTMSRNTYKLDPAFYLTSPHLLFDAMLRKTQPCSG